MEWEQFVDEFEPLENDVVEEAPIDGFLFETYGKEYEKVKATDKNCVWTIVDGDDNNLHVIEGLHYVNRVGYLITKNPFEEGKEYNIKV